MQFSHRKNHGMYFLRSYYIPSFQIRPHLPALARLPHTWTLLYSLDQHGISLNTLYTRSVNRRTNVGIGGTNQGALVAIRDSGDTLFGAWIEEGIQLSKGAYYGSGEA